VIGAFTYYQARTRRNRVVGMLRRLKEPKYLAGVLALLAYFGFLGLTVFAGTSVELDKLPGAEGVADGAATVGTWLCAMMILATVLVTVRSAGREPGIAFKKPELMFLLSAPVSRRQILYFFLSGLQPGLAFSAIVVAFFAARGSGRVLVAALVAFLGFNGVLLLSVALKLLTCALMARGQSGFVQRSLFRGTVLLLALAFSTAHEPFVVGEDPFAYVTALAEREPLRSFLLPFFELARGFLAPSFAAAFPALSALAIGDLLLLALIFARPPHFEEASLLISERVETLRKQGWKAWRRKGKASKERVGPSKPPFELAPTGPVFVALVWKNLIGTGRLNRARLFPLALLGALLLGTGFGEWLPRGPAQAIAAGGIAYATLIGVLLLLQQTRHDLRRDLAHLATLKSYPMSGRDLLQGEVLGLSLVGSAYVALGCTVLAGVLHGVGTADEWHPVGWVLRAPVLVSLIVVGSAGIYMFVTTQNLITLLWPGWVHVGTGPVVGVSRFGGQLVGMVVVSLVGGLSAIVPMIAAGLTYAAFAAIFVADLVSPVGWCWCTVPAAFVFAGVLLVEAQILLRLGESELVAFDVSRDAVQGTP
jgi:hypothetical protein